MAYSLLDPRTDLQQLLIYAASISDLLLGS